MSDTEDREYVAFLGSRRVAQGALGWVAAKAREAQAHDLGFALLVFDRSNAEVVDLDLRGSADDVLARYARPASRRGRPKLGVVSREVTLLPRHWDWLARQPGGASAALRRLIDEARKADGGATDRRVRAETAYRFMSAMAGDLPDFEEASRALFAGERGRLEAFIYEWPADIRDEVLRFLGEA